MSQSLFVLFSVFKARISRRFHCQKTVQTPFYLFTRSRLHAKKWSDVAFKIDGNMLYASIFWLFVILCCEFWKPIQKLATRCRTQCCAENRPRWHVTRGSIFHGTVLRGKSLMQADPCNTALMLQRCHCHHCCTVVNLHCWHTNAAAIYCCHSAI